MNHCHRDVVSSAGRNGELFNIYTVNSTKSLILDDDGAGGGAASKGRIRTRWS